MITSTYLLQLPLIITIEGQECRNTMGGQSIEATVQVDWNDEKYCGCDRAFVWRYIDIAGS
jgi:hypothetical protein